MADSHEVDLRIRELAGVVADLERRVKQLENERDDARRAMNTAGWR